MPGKAASRACLICHPSALRFSTGSSPGCGRCLDIRASPTAKPIPSAVEGIAALRSVAKGTVSRDKHNRFSVMLATITCDEKDGAKDRLPNRRDKRDDGLVKTCATTDSLLTRGRNSCIILRLLCSRRSTIWFGNVWPSRPQGGGELRVHTVNGGDGA
jgi:hypothetical protein